MLKTEVAGKIILNYKKEDLSGIDTPDLSPSITQNVQIATPKPMQENPLDPNDKPPKTPSSGAAALPVPVIKVNAYSQKRVA